MLDFRRVMDERKIFPVNLASGKLGFDAAGLLGRMLVTSLGLAAFRRADTPEDILVRVKRCAFLKDLERLWRSLKLRGGLIDAVLGKLVTEIVARVLAAAVRVVNEEAVGLARSECHPQGIDNQVSAHPMTHGPTHDATGISGNDLRKKSPYRQQKARSHPHKVIVQETTPPRGAVFFSVGCFTHVGFEAGAMQPPPFSPRQETTSVPSLLARCGCWC